MSAKESLLKYLKEGFNGRATDWVAEIVEAADGNLTHKELATSVWQQICDAFPSRRRPFMRLILETWYHEETGELTW